MRDQTNNNNKRKQDFDDIPSSSLIRLSTVSMENPSDNRVFGQISPSFLRYETTRENDADTAMRNAFAANCRSRSSSFEMPLSPPHTPFSPPHTSVSACAFEFGGPSKTTSPWEDLAASCSNKSENSSTQEDSKNAADRESKKPCSGGRTF